MKLGMLCGGLAAAVLSAGLAGCGEVRDEAAPSAPDGVTERFVRKYVPFEPDWISESEIPEEPQESPGMVIWEVSEYDPRVPATPEQEKAAADFVQRCFDAAVENDWFHQSKGIADGFLTPANDRLHARKDEYILDYIQLDPERPEYLMYYPDPNGGPKNHLMGFMFLADGFPADGPEARGHQFAGPLAIWHYHIFKRPLCWEQRLLSMGHVDENGECGPGRVARHRSPEMVHVWLIDHPRGPFSSGMTFPNETIATALSKRIEEHGF